MKIIVRIPTETYAYHELVFDSIEEYETEYPKFPTKMLKATKAYKEQIKNIQEPF